MHSFEKDFSPRRMRKNKTAGGIPHRFKDNPSEKNGNGAHGLKK